MIKVFDTNWNEIDYRSSGLTCLSFIPESLSPLFETDTPDGEDGQIIYGTNITPRNLYARFYLKAVDHYDYQLLRDEIYSLFDPRRDLYLVDTRQPGKRWKARYSGAFSPEYINQITGQFELTFIASKPFSESIGTSLNPQTFDSELWQIGQGLITDETKYIHNTTKFRIYNAGTEIINPKKHPLIIKYKGASTNLQINNNTTLETWSHTGTTTVNDTLELNRLRSLKNSVVNIFQNTNRRSISLAPGWNEIELIGTSGSFEVTFDFRFYYI
ncbi:phage tail family protein [Oceanobacillus arenosus]|uniref:Phage tail family protein n=1 Tax=Oceanobacillus arenosus TaxID=1229153 RepID=A0A3D8PR45_9BACI|nr:distal tail protein Dit [Oceanobacillus arenosus]RDW17639.1 phage tail family protein [Oceanobacillus arenosus]